MPSSPHALPDDLPAKGAADRPISTGGRDSWLGLSSLTDARIALGRTGGSLRTESLIELRLAHAGARDAVHAVFDLPALEGELRSRGFETERLETRASDRSTYLARPDLGRALAPGSADSLRALAARLGSRDLVIIVSDGLSADAARDCAVDTVSELARILRESCWTLYPIFLAPFARVKLQDEIGVILGARHSLILLGERPGLSAHASLGAYMTPAPRMDRTDGDRRCVSNIRDAGLKPTEAAARISESLGLKASA
jgi:ethanolamine ammonia-lyase small subunit